MSLLSDEFKRHGALRSFVSDHFEGVYEYQTRCQTCGYISRNQCELAGISFPHS